MDTRQELIIYLNDVLDYEKLGYEKLLEDIKMFQGYFHCDEVVEFLVATKRDAIDRKKEEDSNG
jgi:hypothetical protein